MIRSKRRSGEGKKKMQLEKSSYCSVNPSVTSTQKLRRKLSAKQKSSRSIQCVVLAGNVRKGRGRKRTLAGIKMPRQGEEKKLNCHLDHHVNSIISFYWAACKRGR